MKRKFIPIIALTSVLSFGSLVSCTSAIENSGKKAPGGEEKPGGEGEKDPSDPGQDVETGEITIAVESGNLYAGEIISLVFKNADGAMIAKSGITIEIIAGNDVAEIKDAAKKTIELKAVGKFTVKATKGQMTGTHEFTVTEAPKEIPDGEMIKITKESVPNFAASITGTKTYPDVASTDTFAVGEDSIDIEWKGGNLGITRNTDSNAPYFNLNCFQAKSESGLIATTNKIVKITKVVVTYVTSYDTIDRFLDFKVGDAVPTKTQGSKKVTEEKIAKDSKEYALNEINVSYDFPEGSEGRLSIERNDNHVVYFNAIYIYGEIVGDYEAPDITEIKTLNAVKTTLDIGDMVEPKFEIEPADGDKSKIELSSENEEVIKIIDYKGDATKKVVKAVGVGKANLVATFGSLTKTLEFTVEADAERPTEEGMLTMVDKSSLIEARRTSNDVYFGEDFTAQQDGVELAFSKTLGVTRVDYNPGLESFKSLQIQKADEAAAAGEGVQIIASATKLKVTKVQIEYLTTQANSLETLNVRVGNKVVEPGNQALSADDNTGVKDGNYDVKKKVIEYNFENGGEGTVGQLQVIQKNTHAVYLTNVKVFGTIAGDDDIEEVVLTAHSSKSKLPIGDSATLTAKKNGMALAEGEIATFEITEGADFATLDGNTLTGVAEGTVKVKAHFNEYESEEISITVYDAAAPVAISAVKDLADDKNTLITVKGKIVGFSQKDCSDTLISFYMADATGEGIFVYKLDKVADLAIGDVVEVTASKSSFNGAQLVKPNESAGVGTYKVIDEVIDLEPKVLESGAAAAALGVKDAGNFYEFTAVYKEKSGNNYVFTFADGQDMPLFVHASNTIEALNTLEAGKTYKVTTVFGMYNTSKQFICMSGTKIELSEEVIHTLTLDAESTSIAIGTSTTLTLAYDGEAVTDLTNVTFAIVDGGECIDLNEATVTGIAVGTAKIKASYEGIESSVLEIRVFDDSVAPSIADIKALPDDKDTLVTVKGKVIGFSQKDCTADLTSFYIADATGEGMLVYKLDKAASLAIGDVVEVTAAKSSFNGAQLVKPNEGAGEGTYRVIDEVIDVAPRYLENGAAANALTIADCGSYYTFDAVYKSKSGNNYTFAFADGVEMPLYVHNSNAIAALNGLETGKTYTITTVFGMYSTSKQFICMSGTLIEEAESVIHTLTLETSATSIKVGETAKLTAKFDGEIIDATYEITEGAEFVSISDGEVLGEAVGTAKVKAHYNEYESEEVTINIKSNEVSDLAVFEFGADGEASHYDGKAVSTDTFEETAGEYTLVLKDLTKVYSEARDATGKSCLKLGTGSLTGSFTVDLSNVTGVTKVVFYFAAYKSNTAEATAIINGQEYVSSKFSNDGEYEEVEIDVTGLTAVTFATKAKRLMVNTIAFR